MSYAREKICPKCHSPSMKTWSDLTDDEKLLAKSRPLSADYTLAQRKKHLFCTLCWFEENVKSIDLA